MNETYYTYDDSGRVKSIRPSGDANPTQYEYVAGGCQSCGGANKIDYIILPEGNKIDYDYDAMGNLEFIKDNVGNYIQYTYDSEGNRLKEEIKDSSSLQKDLSYSYDALNRLSKVINPDAVSSFTRYTYDNRGNRTSVKNPNDSPDVKTTYEYDALSRLITVTQPGSIITRYGYNSNNNLTSVTDANIHPTTYKYDDKGRVYQVISPDTGTTTYGYDPAGNMTSKDANGVTISYIYDALNRLKNISADNIEYTYDSCLNGKGHLCSMTDASGITTYEYTPKGQVSKETKVINSVPYATQYTYDMNGNLKTIKYPSNNEIKYNYLNDRIASVVLNNAANLATNIQYKPFGGMSSITFGNNIGGTIGYDNQHQYRIANIQAGSVMNLSYPTYDANGNIETINNVLDATRNKTFGYDTLDRLTSGTGSSGGVPWTLSWTYDGVGNRTNSGYDYFSNTNRLRSANSKSYSYDDNGNTTGDGSLTFGYNDNQRLISVSNVGASYTYNGNGQRVKKIVNGTTTVFHYSLNGQIIAESNSSGNITAEYVYLNGQPLAKMEGTNTYYYHNDHLGTPQKLTDSTGTVVWAADYKPFGEATITVSTITNNLRFPGQYYDAETGTLYNYFRDYNPAIGRYIEADPIGFWGGLNLYAYVGNNPIYWFDLYGLDATSWGGDGRSVLDGPKNGNWGGKNWSGGWNPNKHGGQPGPGAPTDSGDECYMRHDNCWSTSSSDCDKKKCDKDLRDCLSKLDRDPKKWPRPPRPGTQDDSDNFRRSADKFFR